MPEKFPDDDFPFDDDIDDFGADEEECEPDVLEQMKQEARRNPINYEDRSSNQDILPVEEQRYPRDEHGKRSLEYVDEQYVSPERKAEVEEILKKMRAEIGGPFSNNWVNPAKREQQ